MIAVNLNSRIINEQSPIVNRAAFNAALLASATPYLCGVIDAEQNRDDQATDRFTKESDIAEYREGFLETTKARGRADCGACVYNPPSPRFSTACDAYVRAYNDA